MSLYVKYVPLGVSGSGGMGGVTNVGALDGGGTSANGAIIIGQILYMESASATFPGLVNNTTQSFSGNKTFTGTIAASNLSGTNTGDVTLGTANGLSITGQVLSLGLSSASTTGALSAADWTTFNSKQPAGSYVLTSEVGAANGVASLDASSKIPVSQLPSVVMEYEGAWDPNTNSPTLSDGTGTNGNVYYVTAQRAAAVSGLTDPSMVNFQIGDLIIYSSSIGKWQLVTPAAGVQSVNGAQGAVIINAINQLTGDVVAGPASGSASASSTIQANVVSNSKLAQMSSHTYKGNNTGSLSNPLDITSTQLTADLDLFSASLKGLTPSSGGGTTNFLRADGTWAVPPGSGSGTVTSVGLSLPSIFTVTNSPVTTTGTLTGSFNTQTAGTYFSGPYNGSAAVPTFKAFQPPTVQNFTAATSGTYTLPSGVLYIRVRMIGGGGGGAGGGTAGSSPAAAVTGGATTFGTTLLSAGGGIGCPFVGQVNGANGGSSSLGSGPIGMAITGGTGGGGGFQVGANQTYAIGGMGGSSAFGGAGSNGGPGAGSNGVTNTGGGGGGGGSGNTATSIGGGGGGSGGFIDAIITSPSSTYSYTVGSGGAGGGAGGSGFAGGTGGSGMIIVEEYYQ